MTLEQSLRPAHLRPGEGRKVRLITDLITIRVTTDAISLVEAETPPGGGFPPNARRHDDLTLYVLAGTYTVLLGGDVIELGPGGHAFVSRGTVHGYVNTGAEPARVLVLATPGGVQERFLDEIADHASRAPWEPNMDRLLAVAPKYGIELRDPDATDDAGGAGA
jgi:quercetin dioxygenase-like cupin family protein